MPTNLMSEKTAKKVYFALRKHGPMTVAQLAEETGYSTQAVRNVLQYSVPHLVKRMDEKWDRAYVYKVKNKTTGFSLYTDEVGTYSSSDNGGVEPITVEPITVQVETPPASSAGIAVQVAALENQVAGLKAENSELKTMNERFLADINQLNTVLDEIQRLASQGS